MRKIDKGGILSFFILVKTFSLLSKIAISSVYFVVFDI